MSTISAALLLLCLGQAPVQTVADPRLKAIAPFVESDVFAVVQLDLARADLQGLAGRVFGAAPPRFLAEGQQVTLRWSEALRRAGAKELYLVFSVIDMPGSPFAVVPLADGADAAEIGRLFCGGGKEPPPVHFPHCATVHNAVFAGTPAALDRVRRPAAVPRAELSAAFAAVGDESIAARLLVLPSADSRRVLEEMVPNFPAELGGGATTDLTRGMLWVAAGLEIGAKPSLRLVAASQDANAAKALLHLGENVVAFLSRSPEVQKVVPGLPTLLAGIKPTITENRILLSVDAQQAASLFDSVLRPARQAAARSQCINNEKQIGLAVHNYHARYNAFPPAYTRDKDGKPLLSWRVLILPYLEQNDLYTDFHLDEPWDSAHNRALIAKMPHTYRCPNERADLAREGKTRYLAPRGAGTIFRGAEPVRIRDVADGTSNTIMVADAGDENAVVWTKPDDWEVEPVLNVEGVFKSHEPGGSNVLFADGSVHFLSEKVKPSTLRALFTRSGGEVIAAEDW
jgi:prepilin-type processing-associated H-X9-DG protein